jgi:predicted KAP-like P-loop ATPase
MISSDSPISREKEDRLGRSSFAQALAKAAIDFDGVDSFVVGIHGKWGAGKSSVLNLIAEELARSSKDQSQTIDVVRFNPWNFADQNQLVLQFLRQFAGHLRQIDKNSKLEKIKSLLENLNRYSAGTSCRMSGW